MSKDLLKVTKDEKVNIEFYSKDPTKRKEIRQKFMEIFFGELSEETKKEIYFYDQYMWHAFSYKKIPCLEGKSAIEAFKEKGATDVYILFQDCDKVLTAKGLTFELFRYICNKYNIGWDSYVMDRNFKWVFILTHETMFDDETWKNKNGYWIGPFFKSLE